MELNRDTRDRIFAAANQLYEAAGRNAFPTVDAVRKSARVNMNDASAGMKEWRRAQTAQAAPIAVQVPEAVQQLHSQGLAALWQAAVDQANESLRAAQAGWEAERAELDALNRQLGEAYDAQTGELEALQAKMTETAELRDAAVENVRVLDEQLSGTKRQLATAEARAVEIERRAGELRAELDYAHQEAARLRGELAAAMQAATAAGSQAETLRGELATVKAKAEVEAEAHQEQRKAAAQEAARQAERFTRAQAERDDASKDAAAAQKEAAQAREEAATLRGELHAMKEQQKELLKTLRSSKDRS
ncbi:chromosome segregation protein SMC [Xanthomonas oryzae pv. oryzicola]|uniref:DNA-binding protein n=1 Tax=Xanthomonas oryzae TaxID=347 RepID=UPI00064350EE|nr:DNA-binding protein [Xanthomonas oryzae]AKK65862.1 chromosome segregation protein SMC [Xanthomonas oryzae pv. oryzicola]